ncbi:hypothetical protein KFE25_013549 [Diacronema lutheri]|mgnify:CR=1 FL=1|uniref:Uncharacterized protein n=1 Tax=Diacronema lutheri TaxID=2081491 RepID=A0A8J5XT47_DIALT|nr:hypothetical protein KFE25_013549 [Diacronema lutheri]
MARKRRPNLVGPERFDEPSAKERTEPSRPHGRRAYLPYTVAPSFALEPYILSGYRPTYGRASRAAWSVIEMHNETLSIWSHALAAFAFSVWAATDATISSPLRACVSVHAAVYWTSTVAHTFGAVSERINHVLFAIDKSMISVMFLASGLCAASIEFRHRRALLALVAMVECACCAGVIRAIHAPRSGKVLNAAALGAQMFLTAAPVAHLALSGADPQLAARMCAAARRAIAPALIGGVAYALRFPERLAPGRFDFLLHSHQIMHVGTSIGSYFTYVGLAQWESLAV